MEVPISEMLKDKYGIDIDNKDLHELIAQQVEQEVLKRIPKTDREKMGDNEHYNNLPNNISQTKNGLKGIFSKEKIELQIQGVKQFFEDHSLTPEAIKENAKDFINWNTENPTIEKLDNTFSKVQSIFLNEEKQINTIERTDEPSISDKFENLQDLMNTAHQTINESNQIHQLRDFNQSNRLSEIDQRLDISNENKDIYNIDGLKQNIDYSDKSQVFDIYNSMKDTQTMIDYSNPYERNHNTNNLQIEQFSLSTIQEIENHVPMKELNESRISHLNSNKTIQLPETEQYNNFSTEVKKMENNLHPHEIDTISQAHKNENESNEKISESYKLQENPVFQQINGKTTDNENQENKNTNCEIVDVNNNQVFLNINEEVYSVSVNDEDYNKIETNPNNYTFTFDENSNKLTYQAIENEDKQTEQQENLSKEVDNTPRNAPENSNLSSLESQIPPFIEENEAFER